MTGLHVSALLFTCLLMQSEFHTDGIISLTAGVLEVQIRQKLPGCDLRPCLLENEVIIAESFIAKARPGKLLNQLLIS